MKRILLLTLCVAAAVAGRAADFVPEAQMQDSLLQMLADFTAYMKADYEPCREPNAEGDSCGCFRSGSTMRSNEDGVRTNADLGMVCAFLLRYGQQRVVLPRSVTWADVSLMARRSLVFAYSTHKANRLKACADGRYWGSVSRRDHVWESSLWAMSVAFSAHFLWDDLAPQQREAVARLLRAECRYELERTAIPTGFRGDTKAEENGWEADVLAAAVGLLPDDPLAPQWLERMRLFALNSYSHPADSACNDVPAPWLDYRRVADLYRGANLYPDFTLQNHDYFHTSYQNVVIQELGEAAVALALLGEGRADGPAAAVRTDRDALSRLLLHHCREVCDSVLYDLALSDGELAMPNGNDWSLFLYDQITSYATMACLQRDADALMLENRAFQMVRRRQLTTPDGSWLLRSDIGARRMGVQAHRVMMTWLLHHLWPTATLEPATWTDFRRRHSRARLLPCQQVVRASSPSRFACFGWSDGLHSYTGYFAPEPADDRFCPEGYNVVVPFKAHNTGNIIGWYELKDRRVNAVPADAPRYRLCGDGWLLDGHLLCNDSALDLRFALFATPGNALIYIDNVRARERLTITAEKGGLLAISDDVFTATDRQLTTGPGWACVDGGVGIVQPSGKDIVLDRRQTVNSVVCRLLYAAHSTRRRTCRAGQLVDSRCVVYYAGVDAAQTAALSTSIQPLSLPAGWGGVVASDPDGTRHLLVSHFEGPITTCTTPYGPVTLAIGESLGLTDP